MTNAELYLDWINNFLTLEPFAEYYGITLEEAATVINTGRDDHEANVKGLSKC